MADPRDITRLLASRFRVEEARRLAPGAGPVGGQIGQVAHRSVRERKLVELPVARAVGRKQEFYGSLLFN